MHAIHAALLASRNDTERKGPPPQDIAEVAKKTIEGRYNLLRTYKSDFFGREKIDQEALTLVTICDQRVDLMNDERQDGDNQPLQHNVNQNVVKRAQTIWQSACHYTNGSDYEDNEFKPARESLFLAHINIFDDLAGILQYVEDQDAEQILYILEEEIPNAHRFLERNTMLGQKLYKLLIHASEKLSAHFDDQYDTPLIQPRQPEEQRKKPFLVPQWDPS